MNRDIQSLYQQIKRGAISREEAMHKIRVIREQASSNQSPLEQPLDAQWNKEASTSFLEGKMLQFLMGLLSSVLKLSMDRIDADTSFETYGIDSVMVMELTDELEKSFGNLPKTLFFDYQTLRELTEYFINSHRQRLIELMGEKQPSSKSHKKGEKKTPSRRDNRQQVQPVKKMPTVQEKKADETLDVAIIGLSGRYPGSDQLDQFWRNLRDGKDGITEIPKERWDHQLFYDEEKNKLGKTYSKWGGFINGVDQFDPLFFNISPLEAERLDPQERLFLESVYSTMEDAGYTREVSGRFQGATLEGDVGVYVGVMHEEYQLYGAEEQVRGNGIALGGISSSIANRISYFFNFRGPSIALNTMCSSSLTAIHLACRSLQQGECSAAIVGGVNVSVHPNKYLLLGQASFVSSKGRCESFGEGGDGYVPGEGVGSALLKPLAQAIADGDHIYGVIKGTAINHGGKASGYTVPKPNAQAEVITKAFEQSGVHPRTVSYIEAHGTGTSLGDPIEIEGLNKAFRKNTEENSYCAIGSVKSNIGHCESAAGIAGLTKILLQMKHGQLVPSLHSQVLNPNIDFASSPFTVQQELHEWERPVVELEGVSKEYPRIAGLSSFGAGGSNAHMIVQEYTSVAQAEGVFDADPALIVLSAKNDERLHERVRQLITFIEEHDLSKGALARIAYTLQMGREVMDVRLAFAAESIPEMKRKLEWVLNGQASETIYQGHGKAPKETLTSLATGDELNEMMDKWFAQHHYGKLLALWVKGYPINWDRFYGEEHPQRMSLPTYPFEQKRYWVPRGDVTKQSTQECVHLHPLVHQNTSDLSEQRFTSTFTGKEFFLNGHSVQGKKLVPGTVFLEMIREAVTRSINVSDSSQVAIQLKNTTWLQPVFIEEEEIQLHIALHAEDHDEAIGFEIYSVRQGQEEASIHCQGSAQVVAKENHSSVVDLTSLQRNCNREVWQGKEYYERLDTVGIHHGAEQQGIQSIHVGERQVLAKLVLPTIATRTTNDFVLHPSMLDAAVQTSIAMRMVNQEMRAVPATFTPFVLEDVQILTPCSLEMWAWVRPSDGSGNHDRWESFDIDLCDEQGNTSVQMRGFTFVKGETMSPHLVEGGALLQCPMWREFTPQKVGQSPAPTDHVVVINGDPARWRALSSIFSNGKRVDLSKDATVEDIVKQFDQLEGMDHIIWHPPDHERSTVISDTVLEDQESGVLQLFRIVKGLLHLGYGMKELGFTALTVQAQSVQKMDKVDPTHAGVHGLIGSIAKEYPHWRFRLIDLPATEEWPWTDLFSIPTDSEGNGLVYRNNTWYQQRLLPVHEGGSGQRLYRTGGVYVVIGGAGGIGELWSEYMIQNYQAHIFWIGRRAKDEVIQEKIDRLGHQGHAPEYVSADASDKKALAEAYRVIRAKAGQIHGVIHSAVGPLDQSLANMEEEHFREGLTAKVDVSLRMAQVFAQEDLDFILFFSSIGAFGKSAGQSSYAAGCTFADTFAHRLAQELSCPVKVMNWGYWGDVGIANDVPQTFKNRLEQKGIGFIKPSEAMQALELLAASKMDQLAMVKVTDPLLITEDESLIGYSWNQPSVLKAFHHMTPQIHAQYGEEVENLRQSGRGLEEELDGLLYPLMVGYLQSSGLLKDDRRVIPLYRRWFEETKERLTKASLNVDEPVDVDAIWQEWNQRKANWSDIGAQLTLLEATLPSLAQIVTGQIQATDVIFPNASLDLVQNVYKDNVVADLFNDALAQVVVMWIKERLQRDPSSPIRILEVGAGTGGTSTVLFKALKPFENQIAEYCYTDLSQAFLMHAEKEYGPQNPKLTYRVFDVEKPIAGQGIHVDDYDMVIAANVLHATKNIRQTLQHVKSTMKTHGLLVLGELTEDSLFTHLTFGLLEGWWRYEDPNLRIPGCPGLYPEQWQWVLAEQGFQEIQFPMARAHDLGQQIVIAESDGVNLSQKPENALTTVSNETFLVRADRSQKKALNNKTSIPAGETDDFEHELREKSVVFFQRLVGDSLKIPYKKIDPAEPLDQYGIDSILIVQMINVLRKSFSEVSSTLFFEHQTLNAVIDHFLRTERGALIALVGLQEGVSVDQSAQDSGSSPSSAIQMPAARKRGRRANGIQPLGKNDSSNPTEREPIAIIGLTGRYPKAKNVAEFGRNLENGQHCISEIPEDRWSLEGFFEENSLKAAEQGKSYSKWGGFIDGFADFDPLFFNISPREALGIDPQERLFLQACWNVLEDAGYTRERLSTQHQRRVGVFAGITKTGFELCGSDEWKREEQIFPHTSFGSVANRVSYLFNLQGPSMPIDTMCSSSLTAIHEACEHLYRNECELAIAGGVNLYLHPSSYVGLCAQNMLSIDGACKSFGYGGNGFVPGEGVGTVLLKPLSRAIADGDSIHALIRGTGINHGGRTNGYTVPNPKAQGELIRQTMDKAGVDARLVSYIEAHGTGTELGDPIEIAGLSQAFAKDTKDTHFCAIGSVKSNIGHLESAAGIAGITKVISQMKKKKLYPSLHTDQLNPNIDFAKTPFRIQQELTEWKRPQISKEGMNREYPRIAGISSFGAGGANAHVILEEYIPERDGSSQESKKRPVMVVLSAKNKSRLNDTVERLLAYIDEEHLTDDHLTDIAYTLQVGREAMDERFAWITSSLSELKRQLKAILDGKLDQEEIFHGNVKAHKETMSLLADDEMGNVMSRWIEQRKYRKLLELWVKGLPLDWEQCYGDVKPQRISLPTYPFASERYWMPVEENRVGAVSTTTNPVATTFLHPLLHQNTSDFSQQRYTTHFTGKENFLADHQVQGRKFLPGVAYLEMARIAVEKALGESFFKERGTGERGIQLKNVVWLQPIIVGDEGVSIDVGLQPDEQGDIHYEITSRPSIEQESVVHCQGIVSLDPIKEPSVVDWVDGQKQCTHRVDAKEIYQAFNRMGMEYGPSHQVLEHVFVGEHLLFAKLSMPASTLASHQEFVLHPSMMDAALQSPLAFILGSDQPREVKQEVPFTLRRLEIYRPCVRTMWAIVRPGREEKRFLDIDLIDEHGNVCVRMERYISRPISEGGIAPHETHATGSTVLFTPTWKEEGLVKVDEPIHCRKHLFLCEMPTIDTDRLSKRLGGARCTHLHREGYPVQERFLMYAVQMLEAIKKIIEDEPTDPQLIQLVVDGSEEHQGLTSLYALLQSAQQEHEEIIGQLIMVENTEDLDRIALKLTENSQNLREMRVRYQGEQRYIAEWEEIKPSQPDGQIPWKEQGVYLITGGAGRLAQLITSEITQRTKGARIILVGRSPLDMGRQEMLHEFEHAGAEIVYQQVDICDREAVSRLIKQICDDFGGLHGVIHTAGVIHDQVIPKKTEKQVREVFAPKVDGVMYLDEATKNLELDFFVIFSSLAGATGNRGQSDYAAANAFMDQYAAFRAALVRKGERQGHTLSLNWPLWKEGGMAVNEESQRWMRHHFGLVPLSSSVGMNALYQSFDTGKHQVIILAGDENKIKRTFIPSHSNVEKHAEVSTRTALADGERDWMEEMMDILLHTASKLLKVNAEDIDVQTNLSEYGFDSISFTKFANELNQRYGLELTPATFFEYVTLESLAAYLISEYSTTLTDKLAPSNEAANHSPVRVEEKKGGFEKKEVPGNRFRLGSSPVNEPEEENQESNPIAIVGMSGKFPMAEDLYQFWENLRTAKDCISEIPKNRWDWRKYFGDPTKEVNKTNIKWGGFIDGVDEFDPLFFGISPREAKLMDPQQRLLMTYVWKAIEEAGISPQSLSGTKTGIFVGTSFSGYNGLIMKANCPVDSYSSTGLVPSVGPNRMSYLLNLHGPSEPIETACSSSLVAMIRGVQAIENGSCDMAVVGGVNSIVTPDGHISFNKSGMLALDGRCKTFSNDANGYVRSEGVGMLFLKRLKDAERDGNHIYGLVRSTAENHGGRANNLTSPNPNAQAELLTTAYTKANIDPRTVTYMEAHGTGTHLGDPIEINGLKTAFKGLYQGTGNGQMVEAHCGLGSVKSNIGHTELAAGVAGVIKVLLQLQHKTLVKTLHCETVNPYIQLKDSPFYITQQAKEWQAVHGDDGEELPRRAGVSSFGFGGANAHVVIEEYIPKTGSTSVATVNPDRPKLIVLSAKTKEALREQARQLMDFIRSQSMTDDALEKIAYTLQVGRDAMEERLAVSVRSIQELIGKLSSFVEGRSDDGGIYRGKAKKSKGVGVDASHLVREWAESGQVDHLLGQWVEGLSVDWNQGYGDHRPPLISLPTYPFAKERYWILEDEEPNPLSKDSHPLLHLDQCDSTELRFQSQFTGDEPFFTDHLVQGRKVLSGAAILEMTLAAVQRVLVKEGKEDPSASIRLQNIIWSQPIVMEDGLLTIDTTLVPKTNGDMAFTICRASAHHDDEKPVVYCQGYVATGKAQENSPLSIPALQSRCSQNQFHHSDLYEAYETIGIQYGPTHRAVDKIFVGEGELLAKLSLPPAATKVNSASFLLHPSLLDASLQASIGWMLPEKESSSFPLLLPFALQQLEVFRPFTPSMWVYICHSHEGSTEGLIQKLDLVLTDEDGQIIARLDGYTSRVLEREKQPPSTEDESSSLFTPSWLPREVDNGEEPSFGKRVVILCEPETINMDQFASMMSGVQLIHLQSDRQGIALRYEDYAIRILEEMQALIKDRSSSTLIQFVNVAEQERQLFTGLFGMLQTAGLEHPNLSVQLIEVEGTEDATGLAKKLQENNRNPLDLRIKYQGNVRHVFTWKDAPPVISKKEETPWKDHGVYLITGGLGKLGMIFASEIAKKVQGTTLILTGRSALSVEKKNQIHELQMLGAQVIYKQGDVSNQQVVADWVHWICQRFGRIHGVIHSAGVLQDRFFIQKTEDQLRAVLSAKVAGVVHLDVETQHIPLDFFMVFSSLAAVTGNYGQADYATANAFLDAYAALRTQMVEQGFRYGRTLSINWPLWEEGGMSIHPEMKQMIRQEMGMTSLSTSKGLASFYRCVESDAPRMLVVQGEKERIHAMLSTAKDLLETPSPANEATRPGEKVDSTTEALYGMAVQYFKQLLSNAISLPVERIDIHASLERYGIDSRIVMQLNNDLEMEFGSLSKTLFFEYQTLSELIDYFLISHREQLRVVVGMPLEKNETSSSPSPAPVLVQHPDAVAKDTVVPVAKGATDKESSALDIAIVGVAGRYPGARDVDQFWENLKTGKDGISEIPRERWDAHAYYDADKTKVGKTASKWGGFIEGVDQFDPLFFRISPREAEIMDPQERLFLQCAYEVLEDAGYTRDSLSNRKGHLSGGNVGVFVGVMYEEYQLYGAQEQIQGRPIALAGSPASIANRVSYFCNFHGPSVALDTMCSSSLTTIHLACSALLRGECESAIAGGVNVSIHPNKYLNLGQGKFVSSKGRCESFGEGGDGYVPGEGVGAVLLKPLAKAIADGDQIYGVIKGTAVNHGGKTHGYTVPNPHAQTDVISRALREANIDARTISYVEAHGTGTSLGDPIEVTGLSKAFQQQTMDTQFCSLGSAKSNIGHCESAAGIAGLTKVLLQMKHRQLVPSLHSEVSNPNITFAQTPFFVQQRLMCWNRPRIEVDGDIKEYPRRAGISSFGAGGSNAHIVLEEYIPNTSTLRHHQGDSTHPVMVVLSAKSEDQLKKHAARLLQRVKTQNFPDTRLTDIAYTLQVGREAMDVRTAFLAHSINELTEKLQMVSGNDQGEGIYRGRVKVGEVLPIRITKGGGSDQDGLWVKPEDYRGIIQSWVNGGTFDWGRLYPDGKPQKISLPTYPFAQGRYWVPTMNEPNADFMNQPLSSESHPALTTEQEEVVRVYSETHSSGMATMQEKMRRMEKIPRPKLF
ncbi:SDR family NAD(P)-dependent oxidoreductase [Marininema halotolerans]|uniref:Acyl transferase domain-containing protein n=1 Tax=Marininema halotolerans TaxID=1155944 RepID=A0A1I6PQD4_9BACL|nr:SDR family NAD(P)-dependent oxidoreductase [Marininema halotolerans]SFS42411.1 Acyl transferase domain-containing protein [Marininema halotolerans]